MRKLIYCIVLYLIMSADIYAMGNTSAIPDTQSNTHEPYITVDDEKQPEIIWLTDTYGNSRGVFKRREIEVSGYKPANRMVETDKWLMRVKESFIAANRKHYYAAVYNEYYKDLSINEVRGEGGVWHKPDFYYDGANDKIALFDASGRELWKKSIPFIGPVVISSNGITAVLHEKDGYVSPLEYTFITVVDAGGNTVYEFNGRKKVSLGEINNVHISDDGKIMAFEDIGMRIFCVDLSNKKIYSLWTYKKDERVLGSLDRIERDQIIIGCGGRKKNNKYYEVFNVYSKELKLVETREIER